MMTSQWGPRLGLAALAVAAVLAAAPAANGAPLPVDEGGDTSPCVTYPEYLAAELGAPRERVKRILDTDGQRLPRHTIDGYAASATALAGDVIARGTRVRGYPACDGAVVLGEYGHRHGKWRLLFSVYTGAAA